MSRRSSNALLIFLIILYVAHLPMLSCFKRIPSGISGRLRLLSYSTVPVVELIKGKERKFLEGNPIVYNGAVKSVTGSPSAGDEVHVADCTRKVFARGFYNPHSMYRVRVSALASEPEFNMPLEELIHSRIRGAIDKRSSLGLPSTNTNVYRLVNGEGDLMSGLAVDVLGGAMIAQPSALWIEKHSSVVRKVLEAYAGANNMKLLWRRQIQHLKQDGFVPSENDSNSITTDANSGIVMENGIKYYVDAASDQKTGFYCDQRDNRKLLRSYCKGKNVLDLYCYTGGFALNCVAGQAKSVLAVDSSQRAIEAAEKNRLLNGMQSANLEFLEGDCDAVMKSLIGNRSFDLVICDPPKLAPSRATLPAAVKKYVHLNAQAMQLIDPKGGLLLSCTCSAAMTQSGWFLGVLRDAAKRAGRQITILKELGAGKDHPVLPAYPEGKYLTAVLVKVT